MSRLTHSGTKEAKNDVTIKEILARLTEYEDTELTPEQVQELKERDTAKKPIKTTDETGIRYTDSYRCPNCGGNFTGTGVADFCYHCGQRLDWRD